MPSTPGPPPAASPLLQRLDALTDLAHRCHGLLLAPNGKLTGADAAAAAHAAGIDPDPERGRGALELLLLLGLAVGILRADGLRIRAAPLHDAWRHLDDTLRAGLLFAAWCQQVTFICYGPAAPVALPGSMRRRKLVPLFRRAVGGNGQNGHNLESWAPAVSAWPSAAA